VAEVDAAAAALLAAAAAGGSSGDSIYDDSFAARTRRLQAAVAHAAAVAGGFGRGGGGSGGGGGGGSGGSGSEDAASLRAALRAQFPNAYQCGACGFGPVDHAACADLQRHHGEAAGGSGGHGSKVNNACPACAWFSPQLSDWPPWDGHAPTDQKGRAT
jgi:hypothetical protein